MSPFMRQDDGAAMGGKAREFNRLSGISEKK
jgi:hypothetical protein